MNAIYDSLIQFLSNMDPETVTLLVEKSPPVTPAREDNLQRFLIGKFAVVTRSKDDPSAEAEEDEVSVYLALPRKLDKFELMGTVQAEWHRLAKPSLGTRPLHLEEDCSVYLGMLTDTYTAAHAKFTAIKANLSAT